MLGGWKLAAGIGLVSAAALGVLFVLWKGAEADVEKALAVVSQRNTEIAGLKVQNTELSQANKNLAISLEIAISLNLLADKEVAELQRAVDDMNDREKKERNHVSACVDDGPASPVLRYAGNSLRNIAARIESLRAGNGQGAGLLGVSNPGGVQDPATAADGSWPTSQCAFADTALAFGFYAERLARQIAGLEPWENARAALIPTP